MRLGIIITFIFTCISCKNVTEKESKQAKIVVDSTGLKTQTVEKQTENLKLISFLENPINLQAFKKLKKMHFTTSVASATDYYFNPKISNSIFYVYYYPSEEIILKEIDQFVVFKYGENKHTYNDETEILIEFRIFNKDSDLGKANLVGLTKIELETKFGDEYLTLENRIVYSNNNKALVIELDSSKVKSYKYLKLNTEKVDNDLIRQIVVQH